MSDTTEAPRTWPYSEMETYHSRALASLTEPCHVIIAGRNITISHTDPTIGPVTLKGVEVEPGHFTLHSQTKGSLTLHRFRDGDRLEGFWAEHGDRGMWTVTLSDDPEDAVG